MQKLEQLSKNIQKISSRKKYSLCRKNVTNIVEEAQFHRQRKTLMMIMNICLFCLKCYQECYMYLKILYQSKFYLLPNFFKENFHLNNNKSFRFLHRQLKITTILAKFKFQSCTETSFTTFKIKTLETFKKNLFDFF